MLEECIEGLHIDPDGTYVDATFGGGGHSAAILGKIRGGRLIAFDQDPRAAAEAEKIASRSLTFCQANFRYMKKYLRLNGVENVRGVLADLGVSSHQFDSPERGFSTRLDGPIDMRMDSAQEGGAAHVLNTYSEDQLHKILGMYGEVRNAKTLAASITSQRKKKSLARTADLIELLRPMAPKGKENKYYAQVFQALRIEVNHELDVLSEFLNQCVEVIGVGGRLVVLSYHSLEDRMVKNFVNTGKVFGALEKDFYGNPVKPFTAVNRKPLEASEAELKLNSRARSAKLRIAERN